MCCPKWMGYDDWLFTLVDMYDCWKIYMHIKWSLFIYFSEHFQHLMHNKGTGASLVGSFTVEIGDQDEASMLPSFVINILFELFQK